MSKEENSIKPKEVVTHFASEGHTSKCYKTDETGKTIRICIIKPSNG